MNKNINILPTNRDIANPELSKISLTAYITKFGSWNNFLNSIDETPNRVATYSEQDLIDHFYKIKKKLQHTPNSRTIKNKKLSKITVFAYINRFGSWNNFLNFIGEPVIKTRSRPDQDFIDNYYNVKEKLGRIPNYIDMDNKELSKIPIGTYCYRYKNYSNFLKSIGENRKSQCIICNKESDCSMYKSKMSKYCSRKCRNALHSKKL